MSNSTADNTVNTCSYNTNKLIIRKLSSLINLYEKQKIELRKNDPKKAQVISFKISNFKKALVEIKNYKFNILSSDDVSNIKGIGKGILSRIDEILNTGDLEELKENNMDMEVDNANVSIDYDIMQSCINELQRITGIGPSNADKLIKKGITLPLLLKEIEFNNNIDNIPESSILNNLTHHQLIGLKYFNDFEEKIPRIEIYQIEERLFELLRIIDKDMLFVICGSYRRRSDFSGDIDILISHKNLKNSKDIQNSKFLPKYVEKLIDNNIIIDSLTKSGSTKYMGVCKLVENGKARRIDIRCIPYSSFIPAILYFTGNKKHNVRLRKLASSMGYKLSEYSLLKKDTNEEIILTKEEDLYNILSIDFVNPWDRLE